MGHMCSSSLPPLGHLPAKNKADSSSESLDQPRDTLDACGGAGVACIGHGRDDVVKAVIAQMKSCSYVSYAHFKTTPVQELSDWLIESTSGKMQKVYLMCSGSEAVEAALKLSREYFVWKGEPQRVNFIARWESYHGTTVGSLSASGHITRRGPFEPMLVPQFHKISACNPYRQRLDGESDADFVSRKAAELEDKFQQLGPDTVVAMILEPVVGAALGCVPSVPGYFAAMKRVCDVHGALLLFDEVMCGMSRTGTLHAWQQESVMPDLQTVAKRFAGGYQPASVVAAAALKVQRIIQDDNLLANIRTQGELLERLLNERLGRHPNVGDIRGRGLFWGIEFVKKKQTKEPFDPALQVSLQVFRKAMRDFRVLVYHSQGRAGSGRGDHIMVMPAYNISEKLIPEIVDRVGCAVEGVFEHFIQT